MTRVAKSFGALHVLRDVTFNVSKGEAVGVLGPNGAGKSTLFNLIAGELSLSGGNITFDGVDLGSTRPDHRAALGIARSYQIPRPFTHMSVYENVLVGAVFGHGGRDDPHGLVVDVLERTGLAEYAAQPAGSLTLLNRKRLELARALAVRPQLILLDEIAGGLTPGECDSLVALIAEIKATGTTVLWVEHIVHALVRVVDRLVVLASGQLIADGPPETVLANPEVRQIYMGAPKEPLDA